MVLAFQLAIESELIKADLVEANEFSELSDQYNVSGVPHTSINYGDGELIGAAPAKQLIQEIQAAIGK